MIKQITKTIALIFFSITTLVLFNAEAEAQTFKVLRVKGNRALIQLPRGITLEKGETYAVDADSSTAALTNAGSGIGSREHVVGGSGQLSFESTQETGSADDTVITISLNGRYGWNKGKMEYGPSATILNRTGDLGVRRISVGGFYDYNLIENVPGVEVVYGFGGRGEIGVVNKEVAGRSEGGNIIEMAGGAQGKWYLFGSTCVRGEAYLQYKRETYGSSTQTSMGLLGTVGLYVYF